MKPFGSVTAFSVMVCAIAILVAACGGGGGGASGGSSNSTVLSNRTAASDALFMDPANPVNISVVLDPARAVSQVVSAVGGTLNATAADGSQFTLVIPASAVQQDTTITMTPIVSASGVPLTNGMVAGVQFSPDGLFLYRDATLTIVPAVSVPVANQTFLGYSGNGNDLHLVPPASPTAAIQMRVGHFSGNLLGDGTPADRAAFYLRRADGAEVRLNQELAQILTPERQLQVVGVSDGSVAPAGISNYFASFWDLVIQSYVSAANTSCSNAERAQRAYLTFERNFQVMGVTNPYDPNGTVYQQILNDIDATCNGLPNRYAGSFTYSGPTGDAASGTVTFLRDDAACQAAGKYTATTACYIAESVTYTATPPAIAGCTLSQSSYTVSLSNTPASDAALRIDLAPTNGAYFYWINALWTQAVSPPLTITCGTFSWDPGYLAPASLNSGPNNPSTADMQKLTGSFSFNGTNFTWSLTGGM